MPDNTSPFRSLQLLYRALLWGQILFLILAFIIVGTTEKVTASEQLDRKLQVIAVLISFSAFFIGSRIFRKKLFQARHATISAKEKLAMYRSASLIQWALMDAATVFCIVAYIITHNFAFIALALLLLIIFGAMNPFKSKVMLQLALSPSDVESLHHT